MLEKCPHCANNVLFVTDVCPSCLGDRRQPATGAVEERERAEQTKLVLARKRAVVWVAVGLPLLVVSAFLPDTKTWRWGGTWKDLVMSIGVFMFLAGAYWIAKTSRARKRQSLHS